MKHGIVVVAFVMAAGLFLDGDLSAGSLEPPAPPAPTMKPLSEVEPRTPISSLPFTISSPGSYYLTRDVTGVSGQPGITVTASHVTLDLNGFSLIGVPGSGRGIDALIGGVRHLAIRNGVIRNWGGDGIAADFSSVQAENLHLDSNSLNGMVVGGHSIVRNTTARQNSGNGITVGVNSAIIGCTALSNTATGLAANTNSVVSDSAASSNASGITLGAGSTATDCTAQANTTGFGLGTGSRVVHSMARTNSVGISGGEGAAIEGCTVDSNTDDGIRVTNRGLVRGNLARGNTNDGIEATGTGSRIEDNESTQNGVGFRAGGINNLIIKNSAFQNTTEFVVVGGNKIAPISTDPATATPWSNFDL